MRTKVGWGVAVLSALVALAGAVIMVLLGPDSRFTTGPHEVDTDGIAVVTAPRVISWTGVTVDILAEVPVDKPVFVGLGNSVDVENYVGNTARLEVTSFSTPWTAKTREVDGEPNLPGAPTALDWWIEDSAGLGGARISVTLPDETVSIAILSVGASNLSGLEVSMAYGVKGGFAQGASLLLLGLGGLWMSRLVLRGSELFVEPSGRSRFWVTEEVEEVVYVYVDEDGVEHELSADEVDGFEVIEEHEVELEPDEETEEEPDEDEEPEPAPTSPSLATASVLTAGEIAAGAEEKKIEPEEKKVVYVFVDEDGVEHEVGEDELDEFEVIDDEDDS